MKTNGAAAAVAAIDDAAAEAEIDRLSKLDRLPYVRQLDASAQAIGIPKGSLDKLVTAKRREADGENGAAGQGRAIDLPEPEPWGSPIEGAVLLSQITAEIRRYMVMAEGAAESVALWTVHVHALDAFGISPRLAITSPRAQCGKTTLLDLAYHLVPRPLLLANISAAAVFRTVECACPALLADEADTWLHGNDELRGILNSGHRRGGSVIRVVGEDLEPRQFSTWGACAIALIGKLPLTLADRSIPIALQRKRPDETVERFRHDRTEGLDMLARKAARWAKDNLGRLADMDPFTPAALSNRSADNWRPLLAVADAAGGMWPSRARDIALATVEGDQSRRTGLLADIRAAFSAREVEHIASADLADALAAIEGSEWAEQKNGKPITKNGLARLLARDGISPGTVWLGEGRSLKGYKLGQFADAFARYLPDTPNQTVRPSGPAENIGTPGIFNPSGTTTPDGCENAGNPQKSAPPDGLTFQKEGTPEIIDEGALPERRDPPEPDAEAEASWTG